MTRTEILANELNTLARETLFENGMPPRLDFIATTLSNWCDDFEDVPPQNRDEKHLRDALELAREQTYVRMTASSTSV